MIQEILTYIVLGLAAVWGIYKLARRFLRRPADPCDGCSTACGECQVKQMVKK